MESIVVAKKVTERPDGRLQYHSSIDISELKKCLVFFDKIILADQKNLVVGNQNDDLVFLENEGLLNKFYPKEKIMSFDGREGDPRWSQVEIAKDGVIFQKNTGLAHQIKQSIVDSVNELGAESAISMSAFNSLNNSNKNISNGLLRNFDQYDIVNSVFVPDELVSFEEIIAFRQKRESELLRFKNWIKERNHPDGEINIDNLKKELESAISDLNRCMNETFSVRLLKSLKVNVSVGSDSIIGAASGAIVAAASGGLDLGAGVIAGGLLSSVKLNAGASILPPEIPQNLLPFVYAHEVQSNFHAGKR